jgi:hypothetical protein
MKPKIIKQRKNHVTIQCGDYKFNLRNIPDFGAVINPHPDNGWGEGMIYKNADGEWLVHDFDTTEGSEGWYDRLHCNEPGEIAACEQAAAYLRGQNWGMIMDYDEESGRELQEELSSDYLADDACERGEMAGAMPADI